MSHYLCSFCNRKFNSIHNLPWPNSSPALNKYGWLDYNPILCCHSCWCQFEIQKTSPTGKTYQYHQCHFCKEYDYDGWNTSGPLMREKKLCFNCFIWDKKVTIKNENYVARIERQHYIIKPDETTPGWGSGHGGRKFNIKFFDGRIVETKNLWAQGIIPDRWLEQLPNNAEFLPDDSEMKPVHWQGYVDTNNSPLPFK